MKPFLKRLAYSFRLLPINGFQMDRTCQLRGFALEDGTQAQQAWWADSSMQSIAPIEAYVKGAP